MDLSALTLTQLRYLAAVERTRSFRAAAEECRVSQPTLSMQIQKLEEIMGARLFDRSRQPVVPTEVGARVAHQARTILRETDRLNEVAKPGALEGRYRLGVIPTMAATLVPAFLPRFAKRHPAVELVIDEANTERMLRALQDETLDGGFAATPLHAPGVIERPVCQERFWVYVPTGHPFAKRARIRQSDLAEECVWLMPEGHCFRTQVLHLCSIDRPRQVPCGGASVRFESGSFETLIELVDAGLGMTILPDLVVRKLPAAARRARVRPFESPVPVREVSFVHAREHLRREIADAIVDALLEALPEEVLSTRGRTQILSPEA